MTTLPNILQRINWMLGASIIFRVLSAITTLSMTYFLAPEVYAEYSFAMSVSLLTALIAAAGLPDYIVSRAANGRSYTASLVWQSWIANFLLGGLCLLVITAVVWPQTISLDGKQGILLINVATVLASGNVISQAALRAIHRVSTQAKLMLVSISLSTTALLTTAALGGSVTQLGVATLLVFVVMFTLHVLVLRRYQLFAQVRFTLGELLRLLRHTFPYGLVVMLEMAIPVVASYMVLTRFDSTLAGSFNLMITLLLSAMMIATAVDQTFYPVLVSSRPASRSRIMAGYLLFSLFVALPAFLIFFFHAQAIAHIPIFLKYPNLATYLRLLAYSVPLHFVAKVCTVYFRLQDRQKFSIMLYAAALLWLVGRGMAAQTAPIDIGWFVVEGLGLIVALLIVPVLHFMNLAYVLPRLAKLSLPLLAALLVSLPLANHLLGLGLALLVYAGVAWGLRLHRELLALVNEDDVLV